MRSGRSPPQVTSGSVMSERIDVRADLTIAGAAGDGVRGERAARTRWLAAGRRVRFWQAPSRTALRGARRSVRPIPGIGEAAAPSCPDPPGSAALAAADRTRGYDARCVPLLARLRLLARQRRRGAAARCRRRSGPGGQCDRGRSGRRRARRRGRRCESGRSSAAVFLAARQARLAAAATDVVAAAAVGAPRRCRGTRAGSRPSPRRCGRCRPRSAPRRIAAPGRRISQHRLPDTPAGLRTRSSGS